MRPTPSHPIIRAYTENPSSPRWLPRLRIKSPGFLKADEIGLESFDIRPLAIIVLKGNLKLESKKTLADNTGTSSIDEADLIPSLNSLI